MTTMLDQVINKEHFGTLAYTPKDFKSDLDVRWCAGCGGFSILAQVQRILPDLGVPKEKFAFISGIGCSSRFPYYMDVYGFHSIHGRALAVASGLKVARPDLSVWVITGDGDNMSIGGNHFIHACRRNVDLQMIMFNNEIYSLTKGQASPLSKVGQKTKSSPFGLLDEPFNPTNLALGAGATFVARGYDKDTTQIKHLFERAAQHKGFAFVEIYTNCVIFNDGAFEEFTSRDSKRETTINLEHGKPLIFGNTFNKGIKLDGYRPVVVDFNDGIHSVNDLIVHNEQDSTLGLILSNMSFNSDLPRPMGVIQAIEKLSYDQKTTIQIEDIQTRLGHGNLQNLLVGEDFWEIK